MTTAGTYFKLLHMDKKTKIWIVVLLAVVLLGLLGFFALSHLGGGTIAVITVDGQEYKRIDLSQVTESYDIEIDTKYGHNTVHVAPGRICMPHRLVVKIEGSGIDG